MSDDVDTGVMPLEIQVLEEIRTHKRSKMSGGGGNQKVKPVEVKLKPNERVKSEQLEQVRNGFKDVFGENIGGEVFRSIDRGVKGGRPILGSQVQSAQVTGMEMMSVLVRFAREKEKADQELERLTKLSEETNKRLVNATKVHAEKEKDWLEIEGGFKGINNPGLKSEFEKAGENKTLLDNEVKSLNEKIEIAKEMVGKTGDRLEKCKKSLTHEFDPGEDLLKLEKDKQMAEELVKDWERKCEVASRKVEQLQTDLNEARKNYQKSIQGTTQDSGDAEDNKFLQQCTKIEGHLQEAKQSATTTNLRLEGAKKRRDDVQDGISALEFGPALRRTQGLLDNLGGDPQLKELIERNKPTKLATKVDNTVENLPKTVLSKVPVLGLALKFADMVMVEDQERRLNGAGSGMTGNPVAIGLIESLARGKEMDKYQKGFAFTFGFVTAGISHGGLHPLTKVTDKIGGAIGTKLGEGIGHLSKKVGEKIGAESSKGITEGLNQGVQSGTSKLKSGFEKKIIGGLEQGDKGDQPIGSTTLQDIPEGTASPTIPGEGGASFSLGEPPVAEALLEYLGPKFNDQRSKDPKTRDLEERRMRLREDLFGCPRTLDLRPGMKATEEDKEVLEEINQGMSGKSFPKSAKIDKLRLVYLSLGWIN